MKSNKSIGLSIVLILTTLSHAATAEVPDLTGWWGFNKNGCNDTDNQYRVALGVWDKTDEGVEFGKGDKEAIGMYDGSCELSQRKDKSNEIEYSASCNFEGEHSQGKAKIIFNSRNNINLFLPGGSPEGMTLVLCTESEFEKEKTQANSTKQKSTNEVQDERIKAAYRALMDRLENDSKQQQELMYKQSDWNRELEDVCKDNQQCALEMKISRADQLESMVGDKQAIQSADHSIKSENSEKYNAIIEEAWKFVVGEGTFVVYWDSLPELCREIDRHENSVVDLPESLLLQCGSDLQKRQDKMVDAIRSGEEEPKNCQEVAMTRGDGWLNTKLDMGYNPLGENAGTVKFSGFLKEVVNKDGSSILYVEERGGGSKLAITINESSIITDKDKIASGLLVSGYADKNGSIPVTLVNGSTVKLATALVGCIQPN